jgi:hypothetical protein
MKKLNVTLAVLLMIGLTGLAYGEMGKCSGMQKSNMKNKSDMMMGKDFSKQKAMMQDHMNKAKQCIDSAKTTEDLSNCRMNMMQSKQGMMQGNKSMMKNANTQQKINKIKECVNAAGTLQEIQDCKAAKQQEGQGMQGMQGMMKMKSGNMENKPGKCKGN